MKKKILTTKDFGAGWTTWNFKKEVKRFMLDYPPIIEALLNNEQLDEGHKAVESLARECRERFKVEPCLLGAISLRITKVDKVRDFYITEHDGKESIVYKDKLDWISF